MFNFKYGATPNSTQTQLGANMNLGNVGLLFEHGTVGSHLTLLDLLDLLAILDLVMLDLIPDPAVLNLAVLNLAVLDPILNLAPFGHSLESEN